MGIFIEAQNERGVIIKFDPEQVSMHLVLSLDFDIILYVIMDGIIYVHVYIDLCIGYVCI